MMSDLKKTIEQARAKGMDDQALRSLLTKSGWDGEIVDAALQGIFVPAPPSIPEVSARKPAAADHGPKLSSLEAAVHHVLLWFFTLSLSITIAVVSATLFGDDTSISAVSSFLATSVITLIPYGYFYVRYLRRVRREPAVTTGRVWSIITIVLHSLGAMAALITLVAVAINSPSDGLPVYVAATMIALVNALVVAVYAHATFVDDSRRRKLILLIFPVVVTLLLAAFIAASIAKVGPLRADERMRQDLVAAAEEVRSHARTNLSLPADSQGLELPATVEYRRVSKEVYQLCGSFRNDDSRPGYGGEDEDAYVNEYYFEGHKAGRHCFTLRSSAVTEANNSAKRGIEP
jgi:hypothetical protein